MTTLLIRTDSLLTPDLQCDGESPCAQCANTNGKLWQLGCQRGNLQDRLKDKFPSEFASIPRTATAPYRIIERLARLWIQRMVPSNQRGFQSRSLKIFFLFLSKICTTFADVFLFTNDEL